MEKINFYKIIFLIVSFQITIGINSTQAQKEHIAYDTIIGTKIYRVNANYLLISYGVGFNFRQHNSEQAGSVFYTFRIKNSFFRVGYSVVSRHFVLSRTLQKINDIAVLYGKRIETDKANLSFFIGPSLSYGTYFYYKDPISSFKIYHSFSKLGLYSELELTKKIFYDIGIGTSLFATFNNGYTRYYTKTSPFYGAVGVKLNIYFSGAYRGDYR